MLQEGNVLLLQQHELGVLRPQAEMQRGQAWSGGHMRVQVWCRIEVRIRLLRDGRELLRRTGVLHEGADVLRRHVLRQRPGVVPVQSGKDAGRGARGPPSLQEAVRAGEQVRRELLRHGLQVQQEEG